MITTAAGTLLGGAFSSTAGPLKSRANQVVNQAIQNPDQAAQQAQSNAQQIQNQSQELQQNAKQAVQQHGEEAASATSKGGWTAFIATLLGESRRQLAERQALQSTLQPQRQMLLK
jgi:hypothetical protein